MYALCHLRQEIMQKAAYTALLSCQKTYTSHEWVYQQTGVWSR